jgi:hypothetical protein
MVLHGYVEKLARLHELFSYYPVVGRWCRVAARVIVNEDYRRRALRNRFTEHLAGMNERRIEQSSRDGDIALEAVLGIEDSNMKFLDRQILELLTENFVDIPRPAHRRAFLSLLGGHTPAQLERRMYADCTSRSYSCNGGQRCNGLRGEQPKRAAAGGENLLANSECGSAFGSAAQ